MHDRGTEEFAASRANAAFAEAASYGAGNAAGFPLPAVALHQSGRASHDKGNPNVNTKPPLASPGAQGGAPSKTALVALMPPQLNIWTLCGFVLLIILLIVACSTHAKTSRSAAVVDRVSARLARLEHALSRLLAHKR